MCFSIVSFGGAAVQELLPGILSQLGAENMSELRKLAEKVKQAGGVSAGPPRTHRPLLIILSLAVSLCSVYGFARTHLGSCGVVGVVIIRYADWF